MQYITRDARNDDDLGKLWTSVYHMIFFNDLSFEEQARNTVAG